MGEGYERMKKERYELDERMNGNLLVWDNRSESNLSIEFKPDQKDHAAAYVNVMNTKI
jgi:hypothetical protein